MECTTWPSGPSSSTATSLITTLLVHRAEAILPHGCCKIEAWKSTKTKQKLSFLLTQFYSYLYIKQIVWLYKVHKINVPLFKIHCFSFLGRYFFFASKCILKHRPGHSLGKLKLIIFSQSIISKTFSKNLKNNCM